MTETWDGEERRRGPNPTELQTEIRATRQDLGRLATAVATLGSDEKLQAAVDSVAQEQRRHWQRLVAIMAAALLVIGTVVAIGAIWAKDSRDAAQASAEAAARSKEVADYVDHCLVHPDRATPGECGNTAATGQQSVGLLALFCYLKDDTPRTDAKAEECFRKAAAQSKAAAAAATTTTTTRS